MKKTNWLLFLLMIAAFGMFPILANAQTGAVVIKDTSCIVLDPNGAQFEVFDTTKVNTPSKNCNRNISCHGEVPIPPNKKVIFDKENTGWDCYANFDGLWIPTVNWHEVITPSGNVSLTCHFKGCGSIPACPPGWAMIDGSCCQYPIDPYYGGGCCPRPTLDGGACAW
jgi:hypothetical protein